MDAYNYGEIHADHILRNVLGDGESPSLPDDPTEEDILERNPAVIWSHWRDDAAFRSQLLFENTYKELGVPHSVECDASINHHWVRAIKEQPGLIKLIT